MRILLHTSSLFNIANLNKIMIEVFIFPGVRKVVYGPNVSLQQRWTKEMKCRLKQRIRFHVVLYAALLSQKFSSSWSPILDDFGSSNHEETEGGIDRLVGDVSARCV